MRGFLVGLLPVLAVSLFCLALPNWRFASITWHQRVPLLLNDQVAMCVGQVPTQLTLSFAGMQQRTIMVVENQGPRTVNDIE